MKTRKWFIALFCTQAVLFGGAFSTFAQEPQAEAFLDAPYPDLTHPQPASEEDLSRTLRASNLHRMLEVQTPVRSQASRGTCSIFSATAMLESMLLIRGHMLEAEALDLSEEWLEYLMMRGRTSDGSTSYTNFSTLIQHGIATEQALPYIGETWKTTKDSPLAAKRCGHLAGARQTSCLLGHRDPQLIDLPDQLLLTPGSVQYDPEFVAARKDARQFRSQYMAGTPMNFSVGNVSTIKQLLAEGIPVTLDVDFYYGAWNHRGGEELGIPRDTQAWANGVVGYPEPGSKDRSLSPRKPAGHSVLIVGYDDDAEISTRVQMNDGSMRTFTYRGVYYFKNSWGAGSFGVNFSVDDRNYAGYGVITQRYAHEYGGFYRLALQ